MHKANWIWWQRCSEKYPIYFDHPNLRILEVGSAYVNGSIRDHFKKFSTYIGVDWRTGKNVDVVCFAHQMAFDEPFNTVASASMLEHDRHWEKSLPTMAKHMKKDGILLLSWGAALNPSHCREHADDGQFHALPARQVIKLLQDLGLYIHEFKYEHNIAGGKWGWGEVCLVAFNNKKFALGESIIDPLLPEDS